MQEPGEDAVAKAARHVMEFEKHVPHQEVFLAELIRDGHEHKAAEARRVLEALQTLLRLAREHLRRVRERESGRLYR
jgi:hypothetical protein